MLHHMFHLDLPVLEKMLRPMIVYAAIIILLRVFGKRELAQLNPFDLVVLLSVSNTVQNAIIGDDNSVTGGLIGALSLFATNYLTVRFLFRHRHMNEVLGGSATHLVVNGVVDRKALAKELLTESELDAVIHRQGFNDMEDVESVTLEPGGVFAMKGRKPGSDDRQHAEVIQKIEQLQKSIEVLQTSLANRVD